jgi:hypothetical protein
MPMPSLNTKDDKPKEPFSMNNTNRRSFLKKSFFLPFLTFLAFVLMLHEHQERKKQVLRRNAPSI